MPINELRSITTFVRTAELGSLRKAATAQSITPQAASQALAQLEQHLGVRLFHRTTRSMALTEEGLRFLEAAQPALLSLQRAMQTAKITKDEISGPLRIVGPQSMFVPVVGPVIEEFCKRYPDVQPDVQLDDRLGNWVEERVDVGFRIGLSPHDRKNCHLTRMPAHVRIWCEGITCHSQSLPFRVYAGAMMPSTAKVNRVNPEKGQTAALRTRARSIPTRSTRRCRSG